MSDGDDSILHCKCEEDKILIKNGKTYILFEKAIDEITDEEGNTKPILREVYVTNTYEKTKESVRKAVRKHNEKNREAINQKNKDYIKSRYQNDPEFREKQKAKARESYLKKKNKKMEETNMIDEN
jgi:hypothetical protein